MELERLLLVGQVMLVHTLILQLAKTALSAVEVSPPKPHLVVARAVLTAQLETVVPVVVEIVVQFSQEQVRQARVSTVLWGISPELLSTPAELVVELEEQVALPIQARKLVPRVVLVQLFLG